MKKKNIILILILILLSIFVVQYWSEKQDQAEKEKIEQLEIERIEQLEIERIEKEKQEKLAILLAEQTKEKVEKERDRLKKIEKDKAEKKETSFTWHTDVNKAVNISVQTGKPLFFFFTGSDWCGWCKRLVKEVFVKEEFKSWATKNAILVELDFPRRTPISDDLKKQNRELGNMFGVRGYPTGWLVTPTIVDGKVNFNKLGSQGYVAGGPKAWIAGANKILKTK
jgi:protein disulfide-isomerase